MKRAIQYNRYGPKRVLIWDEEVKDQGSLTWRGKRDVFALG